MTSLSKQLQRLAVGHTQSILGDDTRKRSLLFDPKEAANIDRETFYALGINGLQELSLINDKFKMFETTLFSIPSQSFERSIHSQDTNQKIDASLERFLLLLSQYILLKPAQKCVEWLIYRYHIHLYNEDSIMMCILPYHETKLFVRVVQLLQISSPKSKWHWLLPFQKHGSCLTRLVLINHCHKNPGFFHWICDMVLKYIQAHTPVGTDCVQLRSCFAFYTSIITGFLKREVVTEEFIAILKPFLGRGLESPLQDYKSATYMIIAQLCRRVKMTDELCEQLISLMIKRYSLCLLPDCLSCVLLIYQTQYIECFPSKAFRYLMRLPNLSPTLTYLTTIYQSVSFINALLARLIPLTVRRCALSTASSSEASDGEQTTKPNYVSLLNDILCSRQFDVQSSTIFIRMLLDNCMLYSDSADTLDLCTNLRPVLSTIESRFSDPLSTVIQEMKVTAKGQKEHRCLIDFLTSALVGARFNIAPGNDDGLIISLNHPEVVIRVQAVKHLFGNLKLLLKSDSDFVHENVLQRLWDDSEVVVLAVLHHAELLWQCVPDANTLISSLKKLLIKSENNKWIAVSRATIKALCCAPTHTHRIILYLLPYIVVHHDIAVIILTSPIAECDAMFGQLKPKWLSSLRQKQDGSMLLDFYDEVVTDVAQSLCSRATLSLLTEVKEMVAVSETHTIASWRCHYEALLASVINDLIQRDQITAAQLQTELIPIQITLLDSLTQSKTKSSHALAFTEILVANLFIPQSLRDSLWWYTGLERESPTESCAKTIVLLFSWLSKTANTDESPLGDDFKKFLQLFFKMHFGDPRSLLSFLTTLATGHLQQTVDFMMPDLQAYSLALIAALVEKLSSKVISEILSSRPLVASILVAMTSDIADTRALSLRVVTALRNKSCAPFTNLLIHLENMADEIITDMDFVKKVMVVVARNHKSSGKIRDCAPETLPPSLLTLVTTITSELTPQPITSALLHILSLVNTQATHSLLVPYLRRLLDNDVCDLKQVELDIRQSLLAQFTPEIAKFLEPSSIGLLTLLQACTLHMQTRVEGFSGISVAAIQRVTKEFYANLPSDSSRQQVLHALLDVLTKCDSLDLNHLVKRVLKHISIDAADLATELRLVSDNEVDAATATVRDAKRLRRESLSRTTELDSEVWQRIVQVLEVFQNKKKIHDSHKLFTPCFDLLAKVLYMEKDGSGDYLKQLLLSTMYHVAERLVNTPSGVAMLENENMKMEMIVECIRANNNPQTVHHALLLLSAVAKINPTAILNHVITVFAFMGESILRQDDAYSMHIIGKIIESLIPHIIQACNTRSHGPDSSNTVLMVAQVFVAAYQHMPQHRRLVLFTKLVSVLGEREYLWVILLLMMEQRNHGSHPSEPHVHQLDEEEHLLDVEFCLNLCSQFPINNQINTMSRVTDYLTTLPDTKDEFQALKKVAPSRRKAAETATVKHQDRVASGIFDIVLRSARQLRHFRFSSISLLISLCSGTRLIEQVASSELNLLEEWRALVEVVLRYLCQISDILAKHSKKHTEKYWRTMNHKVYDLLNKVMSLLPDDLFYMIIGSLIGHESGIVRRKAMELLNSNLQNMSRDTLPQQIPKLVEITDQLHALVSPSLPGGQTDDSVATTQTTLFSLKLLCRLLGPHQANTFIKVIKLSCDLFTNVTVLPEISACALLCVAEACSSLRVHVIQHLSLFMPHLILMLHSHDLIREELMLMSVVTTLHKLVDNLAHFISPYLLDIVNFVCWLSVNMAELAHIPRPQLLIRLQGIKQALTTRVSARVLLPVLEMCHKEAAADNYHTVQPLMLLFSDLISHMTSDDLSMLHQRTLTFFLICLDFRSQHKHVAQTDVSNIESAVIECICQLVLRLSEEIFRPMLFKFFHWATENETSIERVVAFYRLADRLAEKLKRLFTLFAGHIIKYTVTVLDRYNISKNYVIEEESSNANILLGYTLDCMTKFFLYNSEPILNKERFDHLMQPLIDQIENTLGSETDYTDRINNHLVPCVAQFAAAVRDDSCWACINHQILVKSRSSQSKVRFASLTVLEAVHVRLGEDSVALLTDTVPFLAELMEDENEEVEEKCQSVMCKMEKIHGESLQKYF